MKFLQLTGMTVLLSQAISISAALLVPRSPSGPSKMSDPMSDIIACINEIKSSGRKLESPDSESRRLAKSLQKPYVIPIRVPYIDSQNGE
ncbi:BgTH12-07561 [Blumeria graminis f. sp. triticale]|uniref:BgTH12-07561 n=1 Tax=Blumeria graminis f. sp. triticale TaxID=1689686 RepID=A0A9W4DEL6_BLUGR|nr:BgTH12-07561 [Blumeria graminis f. sp. triticale]